MTRRWLRRAALAALLLAGGCDDEPRGAPVGASASAPSASASAAAPQHRLPGFTATVDGEILPLAAALAFSRGGAALHVTLSTHDLECDKIAGAGFRLEPGETLFDFTLAPVNVPGEGERWMITGSRLGDVSRQGELGRAEVSAFDPRRTVKVKLDRVPLAFPPKTVLLDGELSATGCGILPVTERATVRPQRDLVVELDGKRLTMNGASLVVQKGGRELRLTSEPHACDKGLAGSDVGIELMLPDGRDRASRVRVSGFAVPRPLSVQDADAALSLRIDTPAEAGAIDVAVSGEVGLAGHTLLVDGVAHAESCP